MLRLVWYKPRLIVDGSMESFQTKWWLFLAMYPITCGINSQFWLKKETLPDPIGFVFWENSNALLWLTLYIDLIF